MSKPQQEPTPTQVAASEVEDLITLPLAFVREVHERLLSWPGDRPYGRIRAVKLAEQLEGMMKASEM